MAGLKDGISGGGGGADYTTGTFSGNMTLGDASGDTITVTGTATFAETATFTSGILSNGAITLGAGDDLIGSATSDITINTNKFTVAGASGNTLVAGTFDATGLCTLAAAATVGTTLGVTGLLTCTAGLSVGTTLTLAGDGDFLDSNGNEMFSFVATGSAVNEFTFTNAATGGDVDLSATGGDADIGISLTPKGAEDLKVLGASGVISSLANATMGWYLSASAQALTGSGAFTLTEYYSTGNSTGGGAWTLADATVKGQLKKIQMITDSGDGTLTPTTLNGGTTITFADVGDTAELIWDGSGWQVLALYNCADGTSAPVLA